MYIRILQQNIMCAICHVFICLIRLSINVYIVRIISVKIK